MNFKPIFFSGPMVRAILDGRKTQTRRLIPEKIIRAYDHWVSPLMLESISSTRLHEKAYFIKRCKYSLGDVLWVRETWRPKQHSMPTGWKYEYRATAEEDGTPLDGPWKPSIFMPKDACRLFLKLENIRVQKLHDISKEDAIAEGVECVRQLGRTFYKLYYGNKKFDYDECPIVSYYSLWDKINGEGSYIENPWVYVYHFKIVTNTKIIF
jgi:hypothetical protein